MSSGTETRRRTKLLPPVRCTEEELAAVGAAARSRSKTVSQYVREAVLERPSPGPRPRKRTPAADERLLAQILAQLGKWGSNLNQLAHQANMDEPVRRWEFEELAGQVRQASTAVLEALGRGHQG
jgi:hypothetical protein